MRANLSESIIIAQICVTAVLTYHLVKKYSDYLFSSKWKASYIQYLLIGMKWSMPIVVIHIIFLSIPSLRHNLTEEYFSMKILTVKGISNFRFIIFSIWLILGALFEELIFRGIFLQKLQKFINNALCVIITAGLFGLSHFIFSPIKIGYIASIFIVGLLSGFAFTSTGSCISAIVPHLLNNVICIVIVWTIR
jgi:membrane protease YdiL (CAAX protease family)